MSFLTDAERAQMAVDADMVFEAMTKDRTIIVYKAPIATPVTPAPSNGENLFGFGPNQAQDIFTYSPVTGVFPALIMYGQSANPTPLNPEINARLDAGPISIKVKRNCRDFIVNGQTEKIVGDGKTFVIDGDENRQMHLNTEYFIFPLKQRS